ncbi:MAG TPA: MgtC/SapB family protein [Anaerovoracaceae bacterium]|nr:MgtC/SapB family protein [Anaerovoracaceae bacterium]
MEPSIIILRLITTFALSFIFGIERQRSHKPIGFGAFIFVSVGSCGLAIAAMSLYVENPLPLLGSIVTGIGFLGAGALIKTNDKTIGFTTAASIWLFAIFGIGIGVGQYFMAFSIYILTWVVILFDKLFEKKGIGFYQKRLIVTTNKIIEVQEIKNLLLLINIKRYTVINLDVDKKNSILSVTYLIEGSAENIHKIPKILYGNDWFDSCKIE